jgi:hypothetical protein
MSGVGQNETLSFYLSSSQVAPNESTSHPLSLLLSDHDNNLLTADLLTAVANDNKLSSPTDYYKQHPRDNRDNKGAVDVDMWAVHRVGLYCHYAVIGLIYGSAGTYYPICTYVYRGDANICANSKSIAFVGWGFKFIFSYITKRYKIFGSRNKVWMLIGWLAVLAIYATLTFVAEDISMTAWLGLQMGAHFFMVLADSPADMFCVEIGRSESSARSGSALATAQRVRFACCILSGILQMVLLNGPSTNSQSCTVSWVSCWTWGLSIGQYYGVFSIVLLLAVIFMLLLKEPKTQSNASSKRFSDLILMPLKDPTISNLTMFVMGFGLFCSCVNPANVIFEYYILRLTNFQVHSDSVIEFNTDMLLCL